MRPFVTALTCVALLCVVSVADAGVSKRVVDEAYAKAEAKMLSISEEAIGVQELCWRAEEAGVNREVIGKLYNEYMENGKYYMYGQSMISEGQILAELAEFAGDPTYMRDAMRKIVLGDRALTLCQENLKKTIKAFTDAIAAAGKREA